MIKNITYKKLITFLLMICLLPIIPSATAISEADGNTLSVKFKSSDGELCSLRMLYPNINEISSDDDVMYMDDTEISSSGIAEFRLPLLADGVYTYIAKSVSGEEVLGRLLVGDRQPGDSDGYNLSVKFEETVGEFCSLRVLYPGLKEVSSFNDVIYMDETEISASGTAEFYIPKLPDGTYNYIVKAESGEEVRASFTVGKRQSDNSAYYVVDDDFNMLRANAADEMVNIGWDILEKGGSVSYGGSGLNLSDTNADDGRYVVRRNFETVFGPRVIAEFRLYINTIEDGFGVTLNSGEDEAIRLETKNGAVYSGGEKLAYIVKDSVIGVRFEINTDTNSYDVYLNGAKAADGLSVGCNSIDNFRVFTSLESTGTLRLELLRIMRGYYAADEAAAYVSSQELPPEGIWTVNKSGGKVTAVQSVGTPWADVYSISLADTSAYAAVGISRSFETVNNVGVLTFKAYSQSDINNLNISFGSFAARISNGAFRAVGANGRETVIKSDLAANLWNTYKITADFVTGCAEIQINGKEVCSGFPFAGAAACADGVSFQTGDASTDTVWLDDIYVYEEMPIDEFYPSEPAKLEKDFSKDIIVGIQTCDLWREGKHFGWDKINGYPARVPCLGFYDDGNPEVKDWEIKFMVEHGIDYSIHCWYRPGSTGTPIKEPRNGYSIHDGYFNARYKDKIKFAIAWENNGWRFNNNDAAVRDELALADFKDNIVPFWMEYYFKDPNYLVIDNKIVVNIYNISTLESDLKADTIKEMIEYLRAQIKTLGFDGMYLIGTTGSNDTETLQKYNEYGYDAVYCYSYGTNVYDPAAQRYGIKSQKTSAENIISSIPTIAMGRDDTAWNRSSGGFMPTKAFEELCEWVKDTYFPNGASGKALGDRMISIDNWNELGEGHFFMPTALAGFGYLEALGRVFGQPEHDDTIPKDVTRLGHLYDQSRDLGIKADEKPVYVLASWSNAEEMGKLKSDGSYSNFTISSDEKLVVTPSSGGCSAANTDPKFRTQDNLDIPITGDEIIHIRAKNVSSNTSTKVYFTTTEDSKETEAKTVSGKITANASFSEGAYEDIYLDMSTNSAWHGTLKQLRFDPFEGSGTMYYDVIEVIRYVDIEYEKPEFSASFDGFEKDDGSVLMNVPTEAADVNAKFTVKNPYNETNCRAMVAEYDAGTLQAVYLSDSKTASSGNSVVRIPLSVKPGRVYGVYAWTGTESMRPLMDAQKIE